jgi:hypothetical protein
LQLLESHVIDGVKITLTSEKTDVVDKISKNRGMVVEEILGNRFYSKKNDFGCAFVIL